MKIIEIENYLYTLYKLDDKYFFSVICGTVALYEVTLEFSKEEILNYTQNKKNIYMIILRKFKII